MAVKQISGLTPVVFLSPTAQLEILQDGTTYRASAGQIGALGGGHIQNDITSTPQYFPLFARQSAGTVEVIWTSDPYYHYQPVEGRLSALRTESTQGINLNNSQITMNYTFPTGDNGVSGGPVTVAVGAVITVPTGSVWTIV